MTNKSVLITGREAQKIIGVGETKFYAIKKSDENFPKATKKSFGRPMYIREDIEKYAIELVKS